MSRYLCCENKQDVEYGNLGCNHDHCTGPVPVTNPRINVLLTNIDWALGKIAVKSTEIEDLQGQVKYYREELANLVEDL